MRVVAIITVCFGSMLTAGLLLAGFCGLLAHDDEDIRQFNHRMDEAKRYGIWEQYRIIRRESLSVAQIASHWRSRREVQLSIWVGLTSGIITVIAAQFI